MFVRKKNGGLRLCVDYRELNRKTVPDRHAIPWIQETLHNLRGNPWFSVLDQGEAYHQGFIGKISRQLTSFITPICMNGLNSPVSFQRFMEDCWEVSQLVILHHRHTKLLLLSLPPQEDQKLLKEQHEQFHCLYVRRTCGNLRTVLRSLRKRGVKLKDLDCTGVFVTGSHSNGT